MLTFQSCHKCQIVFLGIAVIFIIQKLMFCKIEKEDTLIILLSAWDRLRDSTAKRVDGPKKPVKGHVKDLRGL